MLQALSNPLAPGFNVRLPSGIVCRILERPGLWQSVDEQAAIQCDLDTVAAAVGTSEPLTYGVFSKDPARFRDRLPRALVLVQFLIVGTILVDAAWPGTFALAYTRPSGLGLNANKSAYLLCIVTGASLTYSRALGRDLGQIEHRDRR